MLKARLPKGIENIRPHLEKVDNIPLQVSLFTDCDTDCESSCDVTVTFVKEIDVLVLVVATREMVTIMQENGEVVLTCGSTANVDNTTVFMKADCACVQQQQQQQHQQQQHNRSQCILCC